MSTVTEPRFHDNETLERLEALYRPGCYRKGEALCLDILEELDPEWEPARLYLVLFLAAQDFDREALDCVDDLRDDSLFEALRQLPFGAGTKTEEIVYEDIVACLKERGLEGDLEKFFQTEEKPTNRNRPSTVFKDW